MQKLDTTQYEVLLTSGIANAGLIRTKTKTCIRRIAKVLESKQSSASTYVRSKAHDCNARQKAGEHEERQRSHCPGKAQRNEKPPFHDWIRDPRYRELGFKNEEWQKMHTGTATCGSNASSYHTLFPKV